MSENGNGSDENDSEANTSDERHHGLRFEAGLRPLSGLFGRLIEGNVSGAPPPSAEPIERTDVDDGKAARRRETSDSKRKRKKRTRERLSEECLVDTHLIDDEFIVTADIPGARKGDVAAGLDPRTDELVISKNGAVVGRVTLPWESPEATRVWFNNGVLEVRVRPEGA